tara:strand:+ start:17747 stop:18871 length:1125 start_codon:yes stop_codon:yes gene_type:complete
MTIPFIDLKSQYRALKFVIQDRINTVLEHGQYIMGPEVQELEESLSNFTGAKHCISVSSGTDALLISLMALGIKSGDEVITTPFTFAATAEVIVMLGAKPIFVDIEEETCNINADLIEAKITERTKAIMPVSLYGQPSDMDKINTIASRYGDIPVVEDAAQSFGATYQGQKSCNLSAVGCTSFFPSKPLGCYGDGGAIFTSDDAIAQACREIRVHGQTQRYLHSRLGVSGRMDTLQCAIVLAKLERFEWELEQRAVIASRYDKLIESLYGGSEWDGNSRSEIRPVKLRPDRTSAYAQYTILSSNRDALQRRLHEAGIPTAIHYPIPINEQPAYKNISVSEIVPVAKIAASRVISLPMSLTLTIQDQRRVVETLK